VESWPDHVSKGCLTFGDIAGRAVGSVAYGCNPIQIHQCLVRGCRASAPAPVVWVSPPCLLNSARALVPLGGTVFQM
jgi:hypothetical protein